MNHLLRRAQTTIINIFKMTSTTFRDELDSLTDYHYGLPKTKQPLPKKGQQHDAKV